MRVRRDGMVVSSPAAMPRFNPRTHESATCGLLGCRYDYLRFNPRTHESATNCSAGYSPPGRGFNPRTHESATVFHCIVQRRKHVSIHALMRVRHERGLLAGCRKGFNPRTHESATRRLRQH